MNFICWLLDHKWRQKVTRAHDPAPKIIRCRRCGVEPYDDVTLPEWAFNEWRFGLGRSLRTFAKRARLYFKSRKCWKPGHDWSPVSDRCQRCGMTGIEDAERGEWLYPEWKKLWRHWLSDRFGVVKPSLKDQKVYAVYLWNMRVGIERSTIYILGEKYMTRYIAYLGPLCLRLHKFFSGDDDRASHTHPWPFITFPLHSYVEWLYAEGKFVREQVVKKFRFHYRPATHEHVVKGPMFQFGLTDLYYGGMPLYCNESGFEPFWTVVLTGPKTEEWGFYPEPGKFIHWRSYQSDKRNLK